MTVLTFPSNPQSGDTYSAPNGVLYTYDGVKWIAQTTTTTSQEITNFYQDSIAPLFTNIVSDNITFTYDEGTNVLSASVVAQADTGNIAFDVSGDVAGIYNSTGSGVIISNLSYLTAEAETAWVSIPPGNTSESLKVVQEQGDVEIWANGNIWTFDNVGHLVLPSAGALRINNSWTKTSTPGLLNTDTSKVIWSSTHDYISSVKLTIQLETEEIGDATGWHSQVCEAVIASRGYANGFAGPGGDPVMTVYGVTYTSTVPLATFTVQRNVTTKVIELVATRTAATNTGIDMRIHSVEMASRD